MRRPARGRAEEIEEEEKPVVEEYHSLASLTIDNLRKLDIIELGEASHYGGHVKIAGRVVGLRPSKEEMDFELTGTLTDKILERYGGGGARKVRVHVCPKECGQLTTGDGYFHAKGYWDTSIATKPWHTNLTPAKSRVEEEVDELAGLREMAVARGKGRGGDVPPKEVDKPAKEVAEEQEVKKKRKKRKRKERTAEGEFDELLAKKEETEELEKGQKTARAIFGHTCLDPNVPRRRRLMKKARRVSKKKEKKKKRSESSESGSSSSSSTEDKTGSEEDGPLFEETRRVRKLSERCPGALTSQALDNVREHLLSSRGELHSMSKDQLSPLFSMYVHQHLQSLASPVLWQEILTVAQVSDLLLRRKVAAALDMLVQRAKSLESTLRGGHYSVSRQLELVNSERVRMAEPAEQMEAARSARDDFRNRTVGSRPHGLGQKAEAEGQPKGRGKAYPTSDPSQRPKGGEKGKGKEKQKWGKKQKDDN